MIRVLRPVGRSTLISGQAFDDAFARSLSPEVTVEPVDLDHWLNAALGSPAALDCGDSEAFRSAVSGFDFLCPNHVAIPLTPLLVDLRNCSRSAIRLLLIAHAPGAYPLEWALLRPLLQAGDLVIAPTRSAAEVIRFLCPEIASHVQVVPHPVRPVPRLRGGARHLRVVSLSRLHPGKLLHRQVDAMAVLRERGLRQITMQIAGPLHHPGTREPTPYARALAARVQRLRLASQVQLIGEVNGAAGKARLLAGAELLINLSTTIEESFGKSVAEALSTGVAVLATRWNGLPETVGDGGACVAVDATRFGVDVPAERIADALAALLEAPPGPHICRDEALRFHPQQVRRLYAQQLSEALQRARPGGPAAADVKELPAAPADGLLGITAPLTRFSWGELFDLHLEDVARRRRATHASGELAELRTLLLFGVQAPLDRLLSGTPMADRADPVAEAPAPPTEGDGFFARVAAAATSKATLGSRLSCLTLLSSRGQLAPLQWGVDALRAQGLRSWGIDYVEVEALRLDGRHQPAFQLIMAEDPLNYGELAHERLRQLAAVCREWGLPGLALPWLRQWLERFPDGPDAGMVHLDRASNAAALGPDFRDEVHQALMAARQLLGASRSVLRVESAVRALEAAHPSRQALVSDCDSSTHHIGGDRVPRRD